MSNGLRLFVDGLHTCCPGACLPARPPLPSPLLFPFPPFLLKSSLSLIETRRPLISFYVCLDLEKDDRIPHESLTPCTIELGLTDIRLTRVFVQVASAADFIRCSGSHCCDGYYYYYREVTSRKGERTPSLLRLMRESGDGPWERTGRLGGRWSSCDERERWASLSIPST